MHFAKPPVRISFCGDQAENLLTTMNVMVYGDDNKRQDRPMKHALSLGRAEMDVLHYVAEHAPVTVRDVADHLAQTKGQVRTTILNSMERLRQKGFLNRKKVDGVFQYRPVKSKGELFQRLLEGFVEAAFGGSHVPLVAYFADRGRMTEAELRMLKKVAARLEDSKE
jgi:predicted transcriptional regulator